MLRLCLLATVLGVPGCGGTNPSRNTPPPEVRASAPTATCVSSEILAQVKQVGVWHRDGATTVCAALGEDTRCWRLDGKGRLHPRSGPAPADPAGAAFDDEDSTHLEVDSTDGKHRARLAERVITIVDKATQRVVRTIALSDAAGDVPEGGVDGDVTAMYFLGDTLLLRDSHAGPHEDVVVYTIDGKLRGTIWREIYHGSITVIGPHRLGLGTADMSEIGVYDVRTHTLTRYARALRDMPACSAEQLAELEVAVEHSDNCGQSPKAEHAACCAQLAKRFRWKSASIAVFDGDQVGLIAADRSFARIPVYSKNSKHPVRTLNLECATVLRPR